VHKALTALADRIADRIAERLAAILAQLFEAGDVPGEAGSLVTSTQATNSEFAIHRNGERPRQLWTVRQVAAHYGVTPSFVYQHAEELGCIRLGAGRCARIRFDPEVVRDRWTTMGSLPVPRPDSCRRAFRYPTASGHGNRGVELLDFERDP
jgi:hypothetical protein